jgi:hypothetical protein
VRPRRSGNSFDTPRSSIAAGEAGAGALDAADAAEAGAADAGAWASGCVGLSVASIIQPPMAVNHSVHRT